jgi:hypothetical protein
LVHPLVLGKGEQMFHDGSAGKLDLIDTKPLKSGVVILSYRPVA